MSKHNQPSSIGADQSGPRGRGDLQEHNQAGRPSDYVNSISPDRNFPGSGVEDG
jgi:hypothetical protein